VYVGRERMEHGNGTPPMSKDKDIGGVFVEGIISGEFDSVLRELKGAIEERRRALDIVRSAGIEVGSEVMVGNDVIPRYLRGLRGVVVEKETSWIWIDANADEYTGRFGRRLRLPISVIENVHSLPNGKIQMKTVPKPQG